MLPQRQEFHPPHVYEDNACYFLTASTVGRRRLLETSHKRRLFRDRLMAVSRKYAVTLYAWVILANHYHLLVWIPHGESLPGFVRDLHSQSAWKLNRLDGAPARRVWYQYWDRFPRDEADFWSFFNYVHINPLKHGYVLAKTADVTGDGQWLPPQATHLPDVHERLLGYPHSSYPHYVRKYGLEWVMDVWQRYPIQASLAEWDE